MPASLHTTRLAVFAAFATQGLLFISLTTRLPAFQKRWDLGETSLSLLLLMMVLLAGAGSVLAETLAKRWDSAALLRGGLLLIVVGFPLTLLAPMLGVFVAALAVYGVGLGMVDATVNMQAVALEHRYARPILPSFHSAWTLGGILGSALTLATADVSDGWAAVLVVVPIAVCAAPFLRRVGVPDTSGVAVAWRPIMLVGLGMVLFYMVDTAAFTWGPTYLEKAVNSPSSLVALATFPYLLASFAVRISGDAIVARFGPATTLRAGAVAGCGALAVVVLAPTWPVAVLGFALTGGAIAVVAPLSFSAAARIAGAGLDEEHRQARVDAVIGRFNQFNYAGSLLGAVMTGLIGAGSLRIGFAVPMVLVLGLWLLAPAFRGRADGFPG